jgi:hypothetical protein
MNRRELLEKVGLGSLATASLLEALATPASADGNRPVNFHLVATSQAETVDGVAHRLFMGGDGMITQGNVVGGGYFVHFNPAAPGVPKPVLSNGSWKAKGLISFDLIGTFGVLGAGILDMVIHLVPVGGPVVEAMLEVVCNIPGAAGLSNPGKDEGFSLSIPGTIFVPGGSAGPFEPLIPTQGQSAFSLVNENRD